MRHKDQRVGVFVDVQNMYYSAKNLFQSKVHFGKILETAVAGQYGGTGQTFPWAVARGASRKVILAGGLHAGNVRAAIRAARPWGVDASSSLETAPGLKDHARLAAFIAAARAEAES